MITSEKDAFHRVCLQCGRDFTTTVQSAKYCSSACREDAIAANRLERLTGHLIPFEQTGLPTTTYLFRASTRPRNVSPVRWKMELARRDAAERDADLARWNRLGRSTLEPRTVRIAHEWRDGRGRRITRIEYLKC